jgi:RimJ/RimL family protein N-acetyltransferase
MKKYLSIKNQFLKKNDLEIVPIRYKDRMKIMQWRNDQTYHLRQNGLIAKKDQDNYFKNVIDSFFDDFKPQQILFSYLERDICIGYGGLVNINWLDKRAEMSFLLDTKLKKDKRDYQNYFSIFIELIKKIAFDEMNMNRIYTETYSFRSKHIAILEANKFILEGSMKEHIYMKEDDKFYDSLMHGCLKKNYEK